MLQRCIRCGHMESSEGLHSKCKACPKCRGCMIDVETLDRSFSVEKFSISSRDRKRKFELLDRSVVQPGFKFESKDVETFFEGELEEVMNRYFSNGTIEEGFEVRAKISNAED